MKRRVCVIKKIVLKQICVFFMITLLSVGGFVLTILFVNLITLFFLMMISVLVNVRLMFVVMINSMHHLTGSRHE